MNKPTQTVHSLRSDFRRLATPEQIRQRMEVKAAADKRTKENQKAIGAWHNEKRRAPKDIDFPVRRSH